MKYIDADKLRTKVNELRQDWVGNSTGLEVGEEGAELGAAESILDSFDDIIDSLQQEQPKVELSEEALVKGFRAIRQKCFDEDIEGWQREKLIARHFYELGRNAKEE